MRIRLSAVRRHEHPRGQHDLCVVPRVLEWNEDGEPVKFGEPDYSDYNEEFDTYECHDCLLAHPDKYTFNEPARLPLAVDRG